MNTDDFLMQLAGECDVDLSKPGGVRNSYFLTFCFSGVKITLRIVLHDESGGDIAITNMTTLPVQMSGKGFGSKAVQKFLSSAAKCGFHDIRATHVQKEDEGFWTRNGFVRLGGETNDFGYYGGPELA